MNRVSPEISSNRLRLCVSSGEAMSEDIGRRWKSTFDVDILNGAGLTELLHIFLSSRSGDVIYGSSGKAVLGDETLAAHSFA